MSTYDDSEVDPLAPDHEGGVLDHPEDTAAPTADAVPDELEVDPDAAPGERLDTGEDIGKTLPVENTESETPLDAPASAVLDPGPDPITPASSTQQYEDRVKYENVVNAQLERWWELNRAAVLDTFLAGGTVELTHNTPDTDDADDDDVVTDDVTGEELAPKS